MSLRGTSVDAAEVERDVREHIDAALGSQQDPVGGGELADVLGRLDSPSQWVPEEEIPAWRRALNRLQQGPEDWRLAYVCFGLMVLGLVTLPLAGPLLWIPAYFLGRAAHSLALERGASLGARRWLVYPPLILVSAAVAVVLLAGPFVPFVAWGIDAQYFVDRLAGGVRGDSRPVVEALINASLVAAAVGLWWIVLAPLAAFAVRPVRFPLVPLADRFQRRHSVRLGLAGLAVVAVSLGLLFLV